MGCYQVTLGQWQAGQDRISIALAIHSFDPRLRVEHAAHCAPLERGKLDVSYSIHMSIRWIEEFDADTSWMLLVERIIPTGIMARYLAFALEINRMNGYDYLLAGHLRTGGFVFLRG